jgi:UDPglucose 6-dehydrogenase
MGTTMHDYLNPEFILFGVEDLDAAKKAEEFYKTITSAPFFKTSIKNAELIKVAYNTFIGMKIVFANVLMEICQKTGADVDEVTDALKLANDRLISGKYFTGGMGDGGACHPRDNIALSWLSRKLNLSFDWFENIMLARQKQTEWLANLMEEYDLPKVILGTSYKPESNLEIGSASLLLKNILEKRGHKVTKYDPYVDSDTADNIKNKFKEPCVFLIGTKHPDFINFDFPEGSVVIDPWRYMPDKNGIKTIRLGENNYS